MKNIDSIKFSICNAINSLSEEELRQLIISCGEFRESEGLLSIRAVYDCDECRKVFGNCENYGFDTPCKERFYTYCNMMCTKYECKSSSNCKNSEKRGT